MISQTNIRRALLRAIKRHGINQTQLAERSGIARPNVVAMLTGRRGITLESLAKLATAISGRDMTGEVQRALVEEITRSSKEAEDLALMQKVIDAVAEPMKRLNEANPESES